VDVTSFKTFLESLLEIETRVDDIVEEMAGYDDTAKRVWNSCHIIDIVMLADIIRYREDYEKEWNGHDEFIDRLDEFAVNVISCNDSTDVVFLPARAVLSCHEADQYMTRFTSNAMSNRLDLLSGRSAGNLSDDELSELLSLRREARGKNIVTDVSSGYTSSGLPLR